MAKHEGDGSFRALDAEKVSKLISEISNTEQEAIKQMEHLKRLIMHEEEKKEAVNDEIGQRPNK